MAKTPRSRKSRGTPQGCFKPANICHMHGMITSDTRLILENVYISNLPETSAEHHMSGGI